jgi:putative oxidoreductase
MKHLPTIAGILLGLLFIMSAVVVLFHLMPPDKMPPPPTAEAGMFMGALGPTGYLTMVKIFELLGGILVAIPKTRNWGLLILGPILVNILAYHAFLAKGKDLFSPMLIVIEVLALYLLWAGRKGFLGLLNQGSSEK